MTHELKVLSEYYWKIPCQKKTFELRKDDRDYKVGDILDLKEWDGEKFTGHHVRREITYILRNCKQYGLEDGYCIIGMQPRGWNYIGLAQAEGEDRGGFGSTGTN